MFVANLQGNVHKLEGIINNQILGVNLSLPQVTKTEFLLTISIQYQAGR